MKTIYQINTNELTQHKGLMIGNGVLGAIIYNKLDNSSNTNIKVSLDLVDLWDHRYPNEFNSKDFTYTKFTKYINNDIKKAYKLFDDCYKHPYPTKLNAGLLNLTLKASKNDKEYIDCYNGMVKYEGNDYILESYIDANYNVIVLKCNKDFDYKLDLPEYFYKKLNQKGLGYKKGLIKKDKDFVCFRQNTSLNHFYNIIFYKKRIKGQYYLLITINQNKDEKDGKKLISNYLLNINKHLENHKKYYHDYFDSASIITSNKLINKYFNLGRYFFACNSRKDIPISCQGVWTSYNNTLPPWKNDLHNDINVEMSYESYLKLNNFKEGEVLINYLNSLREKFKSNSKSFLNADGYYIPGIMSIKGDILGGWPQYALHPLNSVWLIKAYDEYYYYTGDNDFLKKELYPMFFNVEVAIRHLLVNKKGYYELAYHASPEFYENDKKSIFKYQTNFEIALLKYLYYKLIYYSKLLHRPYDEYQNIYDHIRDYYYDNNGILKISKEQPYAFSHRHFSHMLQYKNLKLVDPFKNEKEIKKNINYLVSKGTNNFVGFSFVELAGLYAYIRNGKDANKCLLSFINGFTHENGLHMNNDYLKKGYSTMDCYVMTLEANMGFVTSLSDMVVQSYEDKLVVFPAVNEKDNYLIKDLCFHKLHKISGEYKNNKIHAFNIKLNKPDTINIYNNIAPKFDLLVDNKKIKINAPLKSFIKIKANKRIIYDYKNN